MAEELETCLSLTEEEFDSLEYRWGQLTGNEALCVLSLAARQIYILGFMKRGRGRTPRGTAQKAAMARWPHGMYTDKVLRLITNYYASEMRASVVTMLSEWGGEECIPFLIPLALKEGAMCLREAAIVALGIIGGPEAMVALQKIREGEPDQLCGSKAEEMIRMMPAE